MTAGGHFERVAAVYESLRTTDEVPVRAIGQLLSGHPVTGLDIGCGTGRYTRLLHALLPAGSRLAAADVSAAMLAQLQAGNQGRARAVVPLLAAAEQPPLRAGGGKLSKISLAEHLGALRACFERLTEWDGDDVPAAVLVFSGDLPLRDEPLPLPRRRRVHQAAAGHPR